MCIIMNAIRIVCLMLFIGISLSSSPGTVHGKTLPIAAGDYFPGMSFTDTLSNGARIYLGIGKKKTFSVKDIQGNLFIFEIFSSFCMTCPRNVPVLNTVYSVINNDPELRQKVKVLSVAIGNTKNEAESFIQKYKVLYPVLTDFTFAFHKALGNPRVPYTIIVKRDAWGKCIVVYTYPGVIESGESLLKEVQELLRQRPPLR